MKNYMIIVKVNGQNYLSRVQAETAIGAERAILDKSISSKYGYGVEACMAYDDEAMKTDTFIYKALDAMPLGLNELGKEIDKANERISKREEAEKELKAIESKIAMLENQMEYLDLKKEELLKIIYH